MYIITLTKEKDAKEEMKKNLPSSS